MIKIILQKIKFFFQKKRSFKSVRKICEHPIYLYKVGKYIPCGKCKACKNIRDLVKYQDYIEKFKRSGTWQIVH